VVSRDALGKVRDQRIERGSTIFASFRILPFQLKALVVYSADCLSCLLRNDGYLARLAKKLLKAACKWRKNHFLLNRWVKP
jgi:hypothetical protein